MNLTDHRRTSPLRAFEEVARRAEAAGAAVAGSEVVGHVTEAALADRLLAKARVLDFREDQVLERRLASRRGTG
jgi:glutamate formiminotransferase